MATRPTSFLDRPAARVLAAFVFVACLAALAWLERDRFAPAAARAPAPADAAFAACYEARAADIDRMVEEAVVTPEQAAAFKARAEAMCRAEAGDGSPGPGLPPLPAD